MKITHLLATRYSLLATASALALAAFTASCSKQPDTKPDAKPAEKAEPKAETKTVAKATKAGASAKSIPADAKNTLTVTRNRQIATLTWQINAATGKITEISVWRSATGKTNIRRKIAGLEPKATTYADTLPNETAQWYWLRLQFDDGKYQEVGPARVEADKAGASGYTNPEDNYKVTITRTDDFATLKWDFPESVYEEIKIVRAPRPISSPFVQNRKKGATNASPVTTTVEGKSQTTNPLPDANSEYWYWFRVTQKSGAIIYKGPIKAEYQRRSKSGQ